jgi:hypothetical protein
MEKNPQHTPPQHEGQEHHFLDYQHVDVYFVYSLVWNTNEISWDKLCDDFNQKGSWILPRLHDRAVCHDDVQLVANYQPSLVSKRRVLERNQLVEKNATLILPIIPNCPLTDDRHRKVTLDLGYTIRIFHNGAMTCTFRACLKKEPDDDNASMFEKIHAVLHLARNVDYVSCEHGHGRAERERWDHLTDAYLLSKDNKPSNSEEDRSFWPNNNEYCTLHDLFRTLIETPPTWAQYHDAAIWAEPDTLDADDPYQDFQTPFVVTVAEVERNSFLRFRKHPTMESAREVASIMCKLTLDNREIRNDYLNLSEDYITSVINYNPLRKGLVNYCLDRRLFFSFSKRGAITITANLSDIPSCFVVPSFINLLEILRARWTMCCILNMQVDSLIDDFSQPFEGQMPSDEKVAYEPSLIDKLVQLRQSYTRFLRDPIPYLFDGGSVTEIAQKAMIELNMNELSEGIHRKMQIVDAMRQDLEDKEREKRREKFDEEWHRINMLPQERQDA